MSEYTIKEDGANGSIEVDSDEIVRTHKKRLGRDDKVRIPMRTVSSVELDRQIGGDVVRVRTLDAEYEWKLADAEAKQLVNEIKSHIRD